MLRGSSRLDPYPAASDRAAGLRFAFLCVAAYVALSWAFRFDMRLGNQMASLVYPLDTFSMYATAPPNRISRLLIRDAQGGVHHIEEFRAFDCGDEAITGDGVRCSEALGIDYIYEKLTHYIATHPGLGDREVELIGRTWFLEPGRAPRQERDCVVARCRVAP